MRLCSDRFGYTDKINTQKSNSARRLIVGYFRQVSTFSGFSIFGLILALGKFYGNRPMKGKKLCLIRKIK